MYYKKEVERVSDTTDTRMTTQDHLSQVYLTEHSHSEESIKNFILVCNVY